MAYSPLWDGGLASRGYLHYTGIDFNDFTWRSDRALRADYAAPHRPGPAYYVFIEEIANPEESGFLDGPDGKDVDRSKHPVFTASPVRFRSSGIAIQDFHDIVGSFKELDPDDIPDDLRDERKKDLVEFLGEVPLPILDLYIPPDHRDLRAVRMMLTPGSWHILGVSRSSLLSEECPVLIGAPELGESPYAFSYLAYMGAVPAHIEVRLRDIFSLAHIADAKFDEEREGGDISGPPPDKPPSGDLGEGAALADDAYGPEAATGEDPLAGTYRAPPEMEA